MTLISAGLAAAWLGVLTSISPCPLATNVAAISFLARQLDSSRRAMLGVISYAVGRATAYATIGLLVAWGVAAAPTTSRLLQAALEPVIGPLLIVVGLVLFGAQAGARLVGGLQRWQGVLQTANGWLIVAIGIYLTLSGTLGVI